MCCISFKCCLGGLAEQPKLCDLQQTVLETDFLTQPLFFNDFIDHLTKYTIRYITQAEAWQTEPQQTGPGPSTDAQKPCQLFFLLKSKKMSKASTMSIIIFLTCYEHIDPLFIYFFLNIFSLPVVLIS